MNKSWIFVSFFSVASCGHKALIGFVNLWSNFHLMDLLIIVEDKSRRFSQASSRTLLYASEVQQIGEPRFELDICNMPKDKSPVQSKLFAPQMTSPRQSFHSHSIPSQEGAPRNQPGPRIPVRRIHPEVLEAKQTQENCSRRCNSSTPTFKEYNGIHQENYIVNCNGIYRNNSFTKYMERWARRLELSDFVPTTNC